jgi:integrase
MNKVEPIRDKDTIKNIINYLKKVNERNYILFMVGIYTGLRIGDILRLKVRDVYNKSGIKIKTEKTGTEIDMKFSKELKKALNDYIRGKDSNEYLIKSRQGYNKPISRIQAYRILEDIAIRFDLNNIGCHSLRKTFGYHYYYATDKDIVAVQRALGHSDPSITLRYIGIIKADIDRGIDNLKF